MARYIDADKFKGNLERAMEKMHLIGGVKGVDVAAVIVALDRQPTADVAPRAEWISVEERLPEDGELVLCILYGDVNGCRVYEGAYELAMHFNACEDDGEFFEEEWEMWDCKRGEVSNIKVTHWMPLPEPPKEAIT